MICCTGYYAKCDARDAEKQTFFVGFDLVDTFLKRKKSHFFFILKKVCIFAPWIKREAMNRSSVVNQISRTIHRLEPGATAILYGSEARGDARPDSDIDILILLDGDKRDLQRENNLSGELYEIELSTGVLISPMIMLRKQWENRPFKTPFYINVMNEGISL